MSSCPVDIWTFCLDELSPVVLSPEETARAERFRFHDIRQRWSNARSTLRTTLALYLDLPPLDLVFLYGEHGKPELRDHPELRFNISHSREWAMIAVTRD